MKHLSLKKISLFGLSIPLILVLAACATSQATPQLLIENTQTTPFPTTSGSQNNGQQNGGFQNASLESKLAYGTLKLEGTSNAVTAQEAKTLLPLWQKVKDQESNGTPTPQDIQTVYQEIEKAMNQDQITAIQNMTMNPQDFQTLLGSLGITVTPFPGQGFGNGQATPSAEQQATRTARETQFAGSGGNGSQRTPGAFGNFRGGFRGENTLFIDPLIKLLTTRAGS